MLLPFSIEVPWKYRLRSLANAWQTQFRASHLDLGILTYQTLAASDRGTCWPFSPKNWSGKMQVVFLKGQNLRFSQDVPYLRLT
jgi:hypothetical protein